MAAFNLKPDNLIILGALVVGAFWFMSRQRVAAQPARAPAPGVAGTTPTTGGLSQVLGTALAGITRAVTAPLTQAAADSWQRAAESSASRDAVQYYNSGSTSGDPYNDGSSYASNPIADTSDAAFSPMSAEFWAPGV